MNRYSIAGRLPSFDSANAGTAVSRHPQVLGITMSSAPLPSPGKRHALTWLAGYVSGVEGHDATTTGQARITDHLRHVSFGEMLGIVESADRQLPDRTARVVAIYQRWLDIHPAASMQTAMVWFNLGTEFSQQSDRANAIIAFSNAHALRPDLYQAGLNLGLVLETDGQAERALAVWEQALQPDAARTQLLNQRGRLLEGLKRYEEAEQTLYASLLTDPAQPDVIQHWVYIRQRMCKWPVIPAFTAGLEAADVARQVGPISALSLFDDIDMQRQVNETWLHRKMGTASPMPRLSPAQGYRHERLRIGYLSSDFCNHAMSHLVSELFIRHDRDRFEIYGYDSSIDDGSDIRRRVIGSFDHYRMVRTADDKTLAETIRADEIDILVDLNGLTQGTRLAALRWKPAPVQMTYLGYIGPVPLPELDYIIADEYVVPAGSIAQYAPAPLRLPSGFQANNTRAQRPPEMTRNAAGLPTDRFVFCCFSNSYKITDTMFDAWMTILHRVPNAVLWLVADTPSARQNMIARAVACNVDADRLLFAGRVSPQDYLARLTLPDLFLDTYPYNGGTITSDVLRMGLPLVTLSGRSFVSRMAGSLLHSMGLHDGITDTLEDYIERAVALACDTARHARFRDALTTAAWRKTVGNIERLTAELEAAFLAIPVGPPQAHQAD